MTVECAFFGPLRDAVGRKTVEVDPEPATVEELIDELERRYPDLEGRLRDGDGLAEDVVVTVNGRHTRHENGLATSLSDGDVVRLTAQVYGG